MEQKRRKVEWIYETPVSEKKNEDFMLGKAVFDLYKNEKNEMRELENKNVAGSLFLNNDDDISNVLLFVFVYQQPNEIQRRINEDPLMAMRKKEMEMIKTSRIKANISNPDKIMKLAEMVLLKL